MAQRKIWELLKAPGLHPDAVQHVYNNWDGYETFHAPEDYRGPKYAASTVQKYHPNDPDMSIADVGAGSGFVGKELRRLGFTNLTAIEGATRLLEGAGDIYEAHYTFYIGAQSKQQLKDDEFDCVVSSGVFIPNHLAPLDINELIRITKPGKLIITVMREEYLSHDVYRDKLEPYMDELESHGCCTKLERTHIPDYYCNDSGYIFAHKVLIHGEPQFKSAVL